VSSELEIVLKSLRAARLANEASIHVIDAVEKLLSPSEPPEETPGSGDTCRHEGPVIEAFGGAYLMCNKCSKQVPI